MPRLSLSADPMTTHKQESGLVYAPGSPIVEIKRSCLRIAASDASVLLTGETGTGKEVFARLVHASSGRANRQFVPVNCGAIPEALLESELFGYVRGAFTGAITARRGRVALAEGGTLFLDEVGELPLGLQVKLLRLLQEKTYEPVGSSESIAANFRLVAATNRELLDDVNAGRFRRDLYYRLHVCPLRLPALRERPVDVTHLFQYFWARRGETRPVSSEVLGCLQAYSWPGNVRELENLVERVSVCAEGATVVAADLPPVVRGMTPKPDALERFEVTPPPIAHSIAAAAPSDVAFQAVSSVESGAIPTVEVDDEPSTTQELDAETLEPLSNILAPSVPTGVPVSLPVDLPRLLRDVEGAYINRALTQAGGNKKEAAKLLGMGRTTLVEKLRRRNADASGL